jgi:hypothetical protein
MKRMWHKWLALVATVTMVGVTHAQNDWNQPSEIGSYQSILSRAGYGGSAPMMQPGVPMQGTAMPSPQMMQSSPIMQSAPMQHNMLPPSGAAAGWGAQPAGNQMMGGMVQGSQSRHGQMQTAPMVGGPVVNGSMTGQMTAPMVGAPMAGGAMTGAPMTSAPMAGGTIVNGGAVSAPMVGGSNAGFVGGPSVPAQSVYSGVVGGNYAQPMVASPVYSGAAGSACGGPVYSAPVYSEPVYSQQVFAQAAAPRANYTAGIFGLLFQRDYEDNRFLARNPSGDTLFTNDADEQNMDGYGLNVARRNANGSGFEAIYWALNPGAVTGTLTGVDVNTNIRGFDRLTDPTSGRTVFDIYTDAVSQTVVRNTDINNLEFNMLRNGGRFCLRGKRAGFYELLGGFRWFQFDESLQYLSETDTATYPLSSANYAYTLNAQNRLLGLQLGARNEICFGSRLRLFSGVKGGIFNNNIRTRQNLVGSDGVTSNVNFGASAGRAFDYEDTKNDVAFLGELDFGIIMNLTCRSRIRLGYRALGVSGVALAADQMPFDYSDANELLRANSNGSLILGGGYYGLEFCF